MIVIVIIRIYIFLLLLFAINGFVFSSIVLRKNKYVFFSDFEGNSNMDERFYIILTIYPYLILYYN